MRGTLLDCSENEDHAAHPMMSLTSQPRPRPAKHRALWVLAATLLLVGCPPEEDAVAPPPPDVTHIAPAPPPPAEAQPTEGEEPAPTAPAPHDTATHLQDAQRALVCLMLPGEGAAKDRGAEMRRGLAIAQEEIAEQNWRNRHISWVVKDTHSTEAGAADAFRACMSEGAQVIIGPVDERAITAIVPVAAAHDAVTIVPQIAAATPKEWARNLFAIAPAATDMGRVAGRDLRLDRGLKKSAVLHVEGGFGESLAKSFEAAFAEDGAKVVATRGLPLDKPDAWAEATRELLVEEGAEGLFVVGPREVAEAVAGVLGANPRGTAQAVFVDWAMHPPVLQAAGTAVTRIRFVNRSSAKGHFEHLFQQRYQSRPDYAAGAAYDAAVVAAQAIEEAPTLYFEDVAQKISALKGIPSAFGTGGMVKAGGIVHEDIGGYRIIEPRLAPDGQSWIFHEE